MRGRKQQIPETDWLSGAEVAAASGTAIPSLKEVKARHIAELLQKYKHSRKLVAAALGISECTLYLKLKEYDLS